MHKLSVLTSSRADLGIYTPLLKKLREEPAIQLQVIAFGTHTSKDFGYTIEQITTQGFEVALRLPFVLDGTSPKTISESIARTITQFADVWQNLPTDLIICLGDRYEMFAAVTASVPYNIPVAHIHGGETTLGAIDNVFRHSLTHMSSLHFTSCEVYRQKVIDLTGTDRNVINSGALSIDNLTSLELFSKEKFTQCFGVDMNKPTILTTFHPETVSYEMNEIFVKELRSALQELCSHFQVIITMPNADTMGNVIREELKGLARLNPGVVFEFENLGMTGYLSAMNHCSLLLGNTSSGFIEAAYFPKWVVNLGRRQEGRLLTKNIRTIPIEAEVILKTVKSISQEPLPVFEQPYGNGNAAGVMKQHLLGFLDSKVI
ncbi:MAG: UDP-N-acetylglucosamine 2-epimerase (hydrolyzing) [Sphingobacteriales bacterium]|nr:MAG: UDP-N-acetylglucosamine 2-epimerase (hydrolyzing) [Sphingobacteriales bacterium]